MSAESLPPRIQTVRGGRVEPLLHRPPLRSSAAGSTWRGIILEEHRADAEYFRPDLKSRSHLIHVFTGTPVQHEWRVEGRIHRVHSTAGSIVILPDGFEAAAVWARRSRPDVQWILELQPTELQPVIQEALSGRPLELVPHFDVRDSQLLRLVQTLQGDVATGHLAGSLFGETVGSALIQYLAQHYSTRGLPTNQLSGGLSSVRLNRVLEHIHANLEGDMHLKELADVAELSTFHFAKLFKRSTGSSPHQYVLQRRLERAKELLRNPHVSLSEVSLRAGFTDQSHLANVFRRFVGVTPTQFRALL